MFLQFDALFFWLHVWHCFETSFCPIKVYEMLCESLAWRRHHNIDNIREIWQPPEPLLSYYSGGWHNKDKGENLVVTKNSLDERLMWLFKILPKFLS